MSWLLRMRARRRMLDLTRPLGDLSAEMAQCRTLYRIVDCAREGRQVLAVRLEIGERRRVVPELLEYCWALVTADTVLAGSRLDITPGVGTGEEFGVISLGLSGARDG